MSKATQANKRAKENFSEVKLNIFFKNTVAFSRRRRPLPLPKLKPEQRLQGPGKQGWEAPTATKKEMHLPVAQNTAAWEAAQISSEEPP